MNQTFTMIPSDTADKILHEIELLRAEIKVLSSEGRSTNNVFEPTLLTREQLANRLAVTLPTIDNWKRDGIIPFRRVGKGRGRIFFVLEDVMKAMKDSNRFKTRR